MSFTRKQISVTFTLASSNFQGTNSNTLTVNGLKVRCGIDLQGGVSKDFSHISIWGLTESQMNQLSTYGVPTGQTLNNKITISAGDPSGMAKVFDGVIQDAVADWNGQPNTAFNVTSYSTLYQSVLTVPPTSFRGGASVATIMGQLAGKLGLKLENNGVNTILSNPYFYGSALDQVQECARAANVNAYADQVNGVLSIWPQNGARAPSTGNPLMISPTTGLVGYPSVSNKQIDFTTIFNPAMVFGRKIQIQSSIKPANGLWVPMEMNTVLETETPDGAWHTSVHAITAQATTGATQ